MVGHLKGGERNRVLGPQGHILVGGLGNKVLFLGENEGVGIHGWKDKELGCCQWGSCENGGRSQVLGLEVESSSCYLQELGCEVPVPEDVPAKVGRCQHLGEPALLRTIALSGCFCGVAVHAGLPFLCFTPYCGSC